MLSVSDAIRNKYGSKRGLLSHYKFLSLTLLGYYSRYKRINWNNVQRLIYVCQGNICRSPLGHAHANAADVPVDSFGLNCQDEFPADPRAIEYAKRLNLDLENHKTQHIKHYQAQETDLIIVMEPMHLESIKAYQGAAQLTLAGLWLTPANAYIHDPFNTCSIFFDSCEKQVIESSQVILSRMQK